MKMKRKKNGLRGREVEKREDFIGIEDEEKMRC